MSHFFDLTADSFAALRLPATLAAVAFLVGPLTAYWMRKKGRSYTATWTLGITMAVFLVAAGIAFGRFGSYLSSKHIAEELDRRLQAGDKMMIYGDQAAGSSLLFYMKRPIYLVNGATTSMHFGSTFPDVPRIFLDDVGLRTAWQGQARIYLFLPEDRKGKVESALAGLEKFTVLEHSEKVVFSNRSQ